MLQPAGGCNSTSQLLLRMFIRAGFIYDVPIEFRGSVDVGPSSMSKVYST